MRSIRPAKLDDYMVFYTARFSDEAMRFSENKEFLRLETHYEWYKKQDLSKFFVICENDASTGYIRFSDSNDISIAIYPWYMRRGYATFALEWAVKKFSNLSARIYRENEVSVKLFGKFPEIKVTLI